MLGAFRKETYSSKLVLKDVVSGSRNVTESLQALHSKCLSTSWGFLYGRVGY
jgi:hypothetical protein